LYVEWIIDRNGSSRTAFNYVLAQYLEETNGAFYLAQCGTWHPVTNPDGYISGGQLLFSDRNHEAGVVNGHYGHYVAAQNDPANNPGVLAEEMVAPPGTPDATFEASVKNALNAAIQRIYAATQTEPCGSHNGALNPVDCSFQGNINLPPYDSCPVH
jgi:hypothetical protein